MRFSMKVSNRGTHPSAVARMEAGGHQPRICMFTTRNYARNAWRCGFYEGQDILSEIDCVDLLSLNPTRAHQWRASVQSDLIWHDITKKIVSMNLAYRGIRLNTTYDLFIADVPRFRDLIQISAIRGWRDHCRTSVCCINELWAAHIPKIMPWLAVLKDFDHIVVGLKGTAAILSKALNRPCHFVPGGVDAIRFSPFPRCPERVIDIYSIGPIWDGLHRQLLGMASKYGLFYIYDTFRASDAQVKECAQHRNMFANFAKRSRYFIVAPAKAYQPDESKDQIEVGFRYFEGSAAGAILLGQIPHGEAFDELFNWQDSVIEIKADGTDVEECLASLASQPERLQAISRRNAKHALLRHDWVYRWQQILDIASLPALPALDIRKEKLRALAEQIDEV